MYKHTYGDNRHRFHFLNLLRQFSMTLRSQRENLGYPQARTHDDRDHRPLWIGQIWPREPDIALVRARKRPPMAVAQSNDFKVLKIWGPEDHKVVLAEFAISGL
jgi:hypothetical protein